MSSTRIARWNALHLAMCASGGRMVAPSNYAKALQITREEAKAQLNGWCELGFVYRGGNGQYIVHRSAVQEIREIVARNIN